ncbi:MAG: hypothetical protein U9R08_07035 [Nanoarchaeota archaeon]|nr:hypothetical protein [Nanoarchaeota archaeon]
MVIEYAKAIAGALNQFANPLSQSNKQAGTTGPMFAILFTIVLYYFLPYDQSIIISVVLNMTVFLFFIRGFRKWIYGIALFQLFVHYMIGQMNAVPFAFNLNVIIAQFIIWPIWPIFGVIVFMGACQNAENRGISLPPLSNMFRIFVIMIIIAMFVSHFYTQFYVPIPSERLQEAREFSLKTWNYINTNLGNALKIVRFTFSCWMEQIYLEQKTDIDSCVKEKMSPSDNETIQGGTDKTIQEIVKADLRSPPYLTNELGTEEAFEVGAVLDVFNPKKEKLDIEVKCKIKNDRQSEIPSKITGTQGNVDTSGKIVTYKNVDRLYSDLICMPELTPNLAKGFYTVTFEATIKNVATQAKLVNLFMARDALTSLITDYAKERKISVTSKTEASVMRAIFPGLVATYYKGGKVESKAEESFLKPMLETRNVPIIGYIADDERSTMGLKVGVQNMAKGTPGKATISFTLPDDMKIVPSECKEYKLKEGTTNVYEYKARISLDKLKYNAQPTALPRCFVSISNLKTINPNVPEPRTFVVDLVYDYTLKKELIVKVKSYGYEGLTAVTLPSVEWKKCQGVFPLNVTDIKRSTINECGRDSDGGTVKFDTFMKYYKQNGLDQIEELDELLLLSLAHVETGCEPSPGNKEGIMQVPQQTSTDNLDGIENMDRAIDLGSKEIKTRFDDVKKLGYSGEDAIKLALYGYNRGKGSMDLAVEFMKTGKGVNEAMLLACYDKYDAGGYLNKVTGKTCSGFDRNACCGAPGTENGKFHSGEGLGARYPEKVINKYKDACGSTPGGSLA